jgi:hypothetical protein
VFEFVDEGSPLTELVIVVLVEVDFIGVGEPAGFAVADAAEEIAVTVFAVVADSKSELCQTRRTPNSRLHTVLGEVCYSKGVARVG